MGNAEPLAGRARATLIGSEYSGHDNIGIRITKCYGVPGRGRYAPRWAAQSTHRRADEPEPNTGVEENLMAADPDVVIQALNDGGIDFSISRASLVDFLGNPDFTPYPALAAALLKLLNRRALRLPVFIDVIVFNYEHSPGNPSPRRIEDVEFRALEAAVIEGFNNRHGEQNVNFESLLITDQTVESTVYKNRLIERVARGGEIELVMDGALVPYGRHPDGMYILHDYAYDPSSNLIDLAKRWIDYQSN